MWLNDIANLLDQSSYNNRSVHCILCQYIILLVLIPTAYGPRFQSCAKIKVVISEIMAISGGVHSIEKLTNENYETWRLTMKGVLICHDLWEWVNRSEIKTEANSVPWSKRTLAFILFNPSKNQLSHVRKAEILGRYGRI